MQYMQITHPALHQVRATMFRSEWQVAAPLSGGIRVAGRSVMAQRDRSDLYFCVPPASGGTPASAAMCYVRHHPRARELGVGSHELLKLA